MSEATHSTTGIRSIFVQRPSETRPEGLSQQARAAGAVKPAIEFGAQSPFVLIGGVNVLESRELTMQVAAKLKQTCEELDIPLVFKASFDKANRSSTSSYRGLPRTESLDILATVRSEFDIPVITDIHEPGQAAELAEVVDVLQIPAFLCRQTDLVVAAAKTAKPIHIKKMQMMAPWDLAQVCSKFRQAGGTDLLLCERGTSFGYNNLIVDMLGFKHLKSHGYPVTFDVTHSLQQPGGLGHATAGRGEQAFELASSALILGLSALFLEVHPDPKQAKCDGPCATPLDQVDLFLRRCKQIDQLAKSFVIADAQAGS